MRWTVILPMYLCGLMLWQGAYCALSADPNLAASEPNIMAFLSPSSGPDPNAASLSVPKLVAGTLAMNWLYQGKKPPQPLVGQEDVTFRTELYPWPYLGNDRHDYFAGPWFYDPWYRYGYWRYYRNVPWRPYGDYHGRWWYNDAYTYPLNYVNMEMKVNENASFNLGVYFLSDPLWP